MLNPHTAPYLALAAASTSSDGHAGTTPAAIAPPEGAALLAALSAVVHEVSARELMPRFRRVAAERKHDGTVVTAADRAVEDALRLALPALVDCPVLGEEMAPASQRALWDEAEWFWCVDPLDGTANFTAGRKCFGISVALMHRRRSVLGVVYDPNRNETFTALHEGGAWCDGRRLKPLPTVRLPEARLEIGRFKRLGRLQQALRAHLPCRRFAMSGASVIQWTALAAGRADVFLHAGEHPWDYAAGALILEEAGGRVATLMHDDYWRTGDPAAMWEQSVIAARHPALFDEWKRWVRQNY